LPGRDLFFGSVVLAPSGGSPVPIPSVAPGSRILRYDATPARRVRFYRDGADNYYAAVGGSGVVRLNYLMDAAATYFGAPVPARAAVEIPAAIRPRLPPSVARVARAVLARLGIAAEATLDRILNRLVAHFRSYGAGATPRVADAADLFRRLATGRVGACRHRAYAFVVLLHAVGVPARFVANEAHAFAEAWLPGGGWRRIDLGGVSPALTVFGGEDKVAHRPRHPDPFPRPPAYERAYSLRSGIPEPDPGSGPAAGAAVPMSDSSLTNDMPAFPVSPTAGATHVRVTRAQQDVLRGESLVVEGRVEREAGRPAAGLRVEVHLTEIGTRQRRQIGVLLSDAKGEFRARLPVPADLGAGRYDLQIEASGARPSP
jgi:transglutaminase-like putative cysteine protease